MFHTTLIVPFSSPTLFSLTRQQGSGAGRGMVTVTPATLSFMPFSSLPHGTRLTHRGPNLVASDQPHHVHLTSDPAKLWSDTR